MDRRLTNIPWTVHRPIFQQQHPKALQPFLPEIRSFVEHNHYQVLHPILRRVPKAIMWRLWHYNPWLRRMLAIGLELPEETFVNQHNFDAQGETYGTCPHSAIPDLHEQMLFSTESV